MKAGSATAMLIAAALSVLPAASVFAHCDTVGGPVIVEAKAALDSGDIAPVLKWIKAGDEAEIRAAFKKAVSVRALGGEARELADQFFLETLVRLHRAGEGAPYTGIKDEPAEPIVDLADKALAAGSVEDLISKLGGHMAQAIREKFHQAEVTGTHKNDSVEAGRKFVEAYVIYMHYVEGIHAAIMSAGAHAHAAVEVNPGQDADHTPAHEH